MQKELQQNSESVSSIVNSELTPEQRKRYNKQLILVVTLAVIVTATIVGSAAYGLVNMTKSKTSNVAVVPVTSTTTPTATPVISNSPIVNLVAPTPETSVMVPVDRYSELVAKGTDFTNYKCVDVPGLPGYSMYLPAEAEIKIATQITPPDQYVKLKPLALVTIPSEIMLNSKTFDLIKDPWVVFRILEPQTPLTSAQWLDALQTAGYRVTIPLDISDTVIQQFKSATEYSVRDIDGKTIVATGGQDPGTRAGLIPYFLASIGASSCPLSATNTTSAEPK